MKVLCNLEKAKAKQKLQLVSLQLRSKFIAYSWSPSYSRWFYSINTVHTSCESQYDMCKLWHTRKACSVSDTSRTPTTWHGLPYCTSTRNANWMIGAWYDICWSKRLLLVRFGSSRCAHILESPKKKIPLEKLLTHVDSLPTCAWTKHGSRDPGP